MNGAEGRKSSQKNIFLFSKQTAFGIATKYFFASLKYGPPSPCRANAHSSDATLNYPGSDLARLIGEQQ